MKKTILFLTALFYTTSLQAKDDVAYYSFLQYRHFGAKIGVDYVTPKNDSDPTSAKKFFPSLLSEEMSYFKNTARTTKEAISYGDWDKEYRVMFGYEQDISKSKTSNSSYGNKDNSGTGFIMADKLIKNNWRLGAGVSFNDYDTDYKNSDMYQNQQNIMTSFHSVYNNQPNQIRIRNVLYLGLGKTKINRVGNQNYKSDFSATYYGLENTFSKTFNFDYGLYLQPSTELNFYGISQNGFDEQNGFKIGDNSGVQIEGLWGLFAGIKTQKWNLKSGPELVHIFSDPRDVYTIFDANYNPVSLKKKYDQKDYVVYKTYLTYKASDQLNIYSDFRYYERENDNIVWTLGINYRF